MKVFAIVVKTKATFLEHYLDAHLRIVLIQCRDGLLDIPNFLESYESK